MHGPEVSNCPSCGGLFLRSNWKVRTQPGVYRIPQQGVQRRSKAARRSAQAIRAQSDKGFAGATDSSGQPVQLVAAVEEGRLAVKPASPPLILKWCSSGQQELQIFSNTLNATVLVLAAIAVGDSLLDESTLLWWQQWDLIQPIRHVTCTLWQTYNGVIQTYPILAKVTALGLTIAAQPLCLDIGCGMTD